MSITSMKKPQPPGPPMHHHHHHNQRPNLANKRSEYRLNYLPFDYYDFWITAKENENLRFKNKLRDYLHTPFDWDENIELYQESETARAAEAAAAKLDLINQATQTSARPNRHDHLKRMVDQREDLERKQINVGSFEKAVQTKKKGPGGGGWRRRKNNKPAQDRPKSSVPMTTTSVPQQQQQQQPARPMSTASVQVDFDRKNQLARTRSAKIERNESSVPLETRFNKKKSNLGAYSNDEDSMFRSMSNMSIQTPAEWNLRDYSRASIKSAAAANFGQHKRSYSMANIQQQQHQQAKRPPFANYGWAVKTKDMSQKPTHNLLANKILAVKCHDDNAINELKMQQLRKEALTFGNEQLANDTRSLVEGRFRSDSRGWLSEYDERYPNHFDTTKKTAAAASEAQKKRDFYLMMSANPDQNKWKKSSAAKPKAATDRPATTTGAIKREQLINFYRID